MLNKHSFPFSSDTKRQKGFVPLLIIPILALLGLGFIVGVSSNKALIANIAEHVTISEPSVSTSSATLSVAEATSTPVPTSTPSTNSSTSTSDLNSITISGNTKISGSWQVNYTVTFPKNGGDITGSSDGLCVGKITGQAGLQDANKQAKFTGNYDGRCQPIVGLSFKTDAKAQFEGTIDYKLGKIAVTHEDTAPYPFRGYFELFFTP